MLMICSTSWRLATEITRRPQAREPTELLSTFEASLKYEGRPRPPASLAAPGGEDLSRSIQP